MHYLNIKGIILGLIAILFAISALNSQPTRIPEYEIKQQEKFLEAHKYKLIDRYDKAEELYLAVYKEDRSNPAVAYELARLYQDMKKPDDVKKYITKAIDLSPENEWFHLFYAEFLENESQFADSAMEYKKVAALNPDDIEIHKKWAQNELKNAKPLEAVRIYNVIEQKVGISESTIREKFNIYNDKGDQVNALLELQKISNAFPENVNYLNNLAGYYREIGKEKEAGDTYQKVLQLDPENPYALVGTSKKDNIEEDTPAYLSTLKTIIQNPQIDIDHKIKELAPYVEKAGSSDQEDQILTSLIQELKNAHPNDAKSYAIYGDVLMSTGKYADAIGAYQKTLKLNKKVYEVWEQLMYAQQEEQQYDELIKTSDKALTYFPNQGRAYFFNALALHYTGDISGSQSMANEALYIAGNNIMLKQDCLLLNAKNNIETKDFEGAKTQCDRGLALNDNHPGILEILGDVHMHMNDADKAVMNWEKALKAGGSKERLSKKIAEKQINR